MIIQVDLVSTLQIQNVKEQLLAINATAEVVHTRYSHVNMGSLLGRGGYQLRSLEGVAEAVAGSAATVPIDLSLCRNVHDDAIRTISLRVSGTLDLERFRTWVEELLWSTMYTDNNQAVAASSTSANLGKTGSHTATAAGAVIQSGQTHQQTMLVVNQGQHDQHMSEQQSNSTADLGQRGQTMEVMRMKGLVNIIGSKHAHMIQVTH